jgi:quinol monooxygenase YgiN
MYIRVSRGAYAPTLHATVSTRLNTSSEFLVPAIRQLPGCLGYYVGSDAHSNTMVNVSCWDTLEHAEAMSSLAEMTALGKEFAEMGVEFERPIINYEVMWQVP